MDCGEPMTQLFSPFGIVFTGVLSGTKYKESSLNGYGQDGHWAWEKATDHSPAKPVFIETFQQQKEFCKRNGLVNPKEVGRLEAGSDGKSLSTSGLPDDRKMAQSFKLTKDQ